MKRKPISLFTDPWNEYISTLLFKLLNID